MFKVRFLQEKQVGVNHRDCYSLLRQLQLSAYVYYHLATTDAEGFLLFGADVECEVWVLSYLLHCDETHI
jgi:hypothetical protein